MLGLLAIAACTSTPPLPAGGDRPDIVLISIDTLRADHVGAYGYERDTTPFLDELAARGALFTKARSPSPWTLPTHTTMLSGLLPLHHTVTAGSVYIPSEIQLVPEHLRAAGYATVGVTTALYVSAKYGFQRGFDRFSDFGYSSGGGQDADAELAVDRALSLVAEQPGVPTFLFLHLFDAHTQYDAPFPWDWRFDRPHRRGRDAVYEALHVYRERPLSPDQLEHQIAQYDEEIRYVDAQLERLAEAFADAGREVIFVITSDHGEEFFERGTWGHSHSLHEELLRVALIVSGPGIPEGATIDVPVGTHDLAPTLASLAGAAMSGDGRDLRPLLEGDEAGFGGRDFFSDSNRRDTNLLGVARGEWRLHWDLNADAIRLYRGPEEREDLAAREPERVAELTEALAGYVGAPWSLEAGRLETEGAILVGGERIDGPLDGPATFAVLGLDADLAVDGAGPWRGAGGPLPDPDDPLRWAGPTSSQAVKLTAGEIQQLKALGYVE